MLLSNYVLPKQIIVVLLLLSPVSGCAISPANQQGNYPVSWTAEYQMVDLLSEAVTVNNQKDLQHILDAPWYAEISVEDAKSSKEISLSNCSQYLSETTEKTPALRENEINALLEFAIMCRSTELLLKAKAAKYSNLPANFLNPSMPDIFPAEMAFQISSSEAEKNNKPGQKWGSINQHLKFESLAKNQVRFFDKNGSQIISLIGRGDFNDDGLEDVLITSRDSVEGGSYFNIRLFALTVDANDEWVLIEEF